MIYKLHYFLVAAGINSFSILLGVFIETYTDASPSEFGLLLMVTPFLAMFGRPILCSMADRSQQHRKYLIICMLVKIISFSPFMVIPFMGEQLYREHARACWYLLAFLKICGDLSFGGMASIGDSLAINYANRVGTSFGAYRVWGTVSWMLFGLVSGQINEVWFLPKYVPAFMILIGTLLTDAFLIWLWPEEYFVMREGPVGGGGGSTPEGALEKQADPPKTGRLMARELVWAQAKRKLIRVFCCGWCCSSAPQTEAQAHNQEVAAIAQGEVAEKKGINKMTQLRILKILFARDKRIIFYLLYFVLSGGCHATMSFFFIGLSKMCNSDESSCNFSQLTGLLQFSMAVLETILFIYIKGIISRIGRLNSAALAMLMSSAKFMFYGTVWSRVNPYYSLLSEGVTGLIYGINLFLMVETAHLFASEVKYIIPELRERAIITPDTDLDKLRYSLAATMQAIVSSSSEGIGAGCGALIYGILLEHITYETLWLIVGLTSVVCLVMLLAVNTIDTIFGLKLGLDLKATEEQAKELQRY